MSLEPGTQLGPYRIEEPAGAGGMGEVYKAQDTRLERTVAIKVLPAHLSGRADLRQRLDREAKTISSLQHPNICALFDVGHENGVDFLVMEYLEGKTLADRLREGPLPAEEVLGIGVQVTEALEAAHKRGVVHRDLKPGNIMLTRAGVKLLDFGLAKTAAAGTPAGSAMTDMLTATHDSEPLTAAGTVLGTFQYMAPEQLEGQEADSRSDIFSLGAVLYEMATGRRAFEGKSQASLIASIMSSQPQPISSIQAMTPPALDRVVQTCLQKDPESRWQTAHDVALQLKWIAEGGSAVGVPRPLAARRRSRERLAWITAAVLGLAVAGLGARMFLAPKPPAPASVRFNIEAPAGLISFGSPRISPNGRFIAFNGQDSTGTTKIWVRPLNALEAYPLPGTEGTNRPFWSPDSRFVGFFSGGKLKRIPVAGGPPFTVCEFGNGSDGSWGMGGQILFDGRTGDSVQVVPEGGGIQAGATFINRADGEVGHGWPFFLPDGKRFVYIAFKGDGPGEIRLGELGSRESTRLTEGDSRVEYVPPGYLIFERGGTLLAQPFDAKAGKLDGDPFPLAEGIGTGDVGLAHFSGARNGTLIYTSGTSSSRQLTWLDRTGKVLTRVGDAGRFWDPMLSPDGKRLVEEVGVAGADNTDLWVLDLKRGVPTRLTFDPNPDYTGLWSPDGSRIAFSSDRDREGGVFVRNADGTGDATKLQASRGQLVPTDWSRDGKTIVGTYRNPQTSWDVVSFDASGTGEVRTEVGTRFIDFGGRLSPDGRYLAYTSFESGRSEVYLGTFPAGGGKWQISSAGGREPMWRGDGKELFYMSLDRSLMAVDVSLTASVEIGVPHRLFAVNVTPTITDRNHYVPDPSGQKFLFLILKEAEQVPPTTVVLNWAADLNQR